MGDKTLKGISCWWWWLFWVEQRRVKINMCDQWWLCVWRRSRYLSIQNMSIFFRTKKQSVKKKKIIEFTYWYRNPNSTERKAKNRIYVPANQNTRVRHYLSKSSIFWQIQTFINIDSNQKYGGVALGQLYEQLFLNLSNETYGLFRNHSIRCLTHDKYYNSFPPKIIIKPAIMRWIPTNLQQQ